MNKIDIYGSFTQALFFSGSVAIPKYLLHHYASLGLSEKEMMLVIHILSWLEGNPYPQASQLGQHMQATTEEIEEMIGRLVERGLLSIEKTWNAAERRWSYSYSILGLVDKLVEQWAIEGIKQYTSDKAQVQASSGLQQQKGSFQRAQLDPLISVFEQELGRPLTAIECEQIQTWLDSHFTQELIVEALRRGVTAGIRSFRYLDSILREWEKKGLRTRAEVEADDEYFQARQEAKPKRRAKKNAPSKPDKYEDFYL